MTARRLNTVQEYYFSKKLREVAAMVEEGKLEDAGISASPDLDRAFATTETVAPAGSHNPFGISESTQSTGPFGETDANFEDGPFNSPQHVDPFGSDDDLRPDVSDNTFGAIAALHY